MHNMIVSTAYLSRADFVANCAAQDRKAVKALSLEQLSSWDSTPLGRQQEVRRRGMMLTESISVDMCIVCLPTCLVLRVPALD